jgi:hypothetical protein
MLREREARGLPVWVFDGKTALKEPLFIAIPERTYSGFTQLPDAQNDASNLVSTQARSK